MNLYSVLVSIFGNHQTLPISRSETEQLPLIKDHRKLTGEVIERVPDYLVRIQLLISREKEILRGLLEKKKTEREPADDSAYKECLQEIVREGVSTGEVNSDLMSRLHQHNARRLNVSLETMSQMRETENRIRALQELFELLDRDHQSIRQVPAGHARVIQYDEANNCLVYASVKQERRHVVLAIYGK